MGLCGTVSQNFPCSIRSVQIVHKTLFLLLTLRNSGKPKSGPDWGLKDSLGTNHEYLKELADGKNFFYSIYVFKLNKASHA